MESEIIHGALKEKMAGFVSIAVDTLKSPEMKICIAHGFAKNGRFTIIRSDDRQALVDLGGPDTDGPGGRARNPRRKYSC